MKQSGMVNLSSSQRRRTERCLSLLAGIRSSDLLSRTAIVCMLCGTKESTRVIEAEPPYRSVGLVFEYAMTIAKNPGPISLGSAAGTSVPFAICLRSFMRTARTCLIRLEYGSACQAGQYSRSTAPSCFHYNGPTYVRRRAIPVQSALFVEVQPLTPPKS